METVTARRVRVPVYLPDETQVGDALVEVNEGTTTIKLRTNTTVAKLIQESLVGFSIVYLDRDAVEEVLNKEKTDG